MPVQNIARENAIRAYKVFDKNLQCRGFQFEIGKVFEQLGEIKLCNNGFHACVVAAHCFNYYEFTPENRVCKVMLWGDVVSDEGDKVASGFIEIVEELSWQEVLVVVNSGTGNSGCGNSGDQNSGDQNSGNQNSGNQNSGDQNSGNQNSGHQNSGNRNSGNWNSGNRNSGNWNSGHCNSGDWNSGDQNSGNWNSGDWNSCDNETGFFNNVASDYVRVFGKECLRDMWDNTHKPGWLFFGLNKWVPTCDMSHEEIACNPSHALVGGYLKKIPYKEAFMHSFLKATKEDQAAVRKLPNFDEDIFFDISGIRLSDFGV